MTQSRKIFRIFFKNLDFHAFRDSWWRLVRGWKVQSRELYRDFRGLACDFLAGRPSSREKHLEKFSSILFSKCFAAYPGNLTQSRKLRVLHKEVLFQYWFQKGSSFFPHIQWMFIFWSEFHSFNTTMFTHKIFNFFVTTFSIFKERFGFCLLFFIFIIYYLFLLDCVFLMIFVSLLIVYGYLIFWWNHCVICGGHLLIYSILSQYWVITNTYTLIVMFWTFISSF